MIKFSELRSLIGKIIDFESLAEFVDPPTMGELFNPLDDPSIEQLEKKYLRIPGKFPNSNLA